MLKRLLIKNSLIIAGVSLLLSISSSVNAVEIANVVIPNKIHTIENELVLRGAGVREKYFMDLYVAGLYQPKAQKQLPVKQLLSSDEHMAIKLHIVSKLITSEKMEQSTRDGFDQSIGKDWGELSATINDFISVFNEEININDVYDLVYEKGEGTKVYKNGRLQKSIPGVTFKEALFGIWLSEDPVQKKLKVDMLGS